MRLYEYTEQYLTAMNDLSDMDLSDEVISDTLEGLRGDIQVKGKNIGAYIRNMEADIEMLKAHEKQVKDKRLVMEKRISWMKSYLLNNMQASGITEISCPLYTIKPRQNPPAIQILDESKIPDEYKSEIIVIKVDKKSISEDLKAGKIILGAALTRGWRLDIK